MNLSDLVKNIDNLSEDTVVYAQRIEGTWQPSSSIAILPISVDISGARFKLKGMEYFLEIYLVKEVISVAKECFELDGRKLSLDDYLRAVIYYAESDAFIPEL
jgi:hypothetical protein